MRKNNILILTTGAILLFVFHIVLSFSPLVANDFPYLSRSELLSRLSLPTAWWARGSDGLGGYSVPFLWFWPMDVLYGLAAKLGMNFAVVERIFGIIPAIVLGIWSIRKLLKHYEINASGIFVGSLIYILNTYFILLIDGGQLQLALSYAWLPIVFLLTLNAVEKRNRESYAKTGLALVLLSVLDIRYVYIYVMLLALYVVSELMFLQRKEISLFLKKWVSTGIVLGLILGGALSYMLLPALFGQSASLPDTYGRISQTNFLSFATMANTILLLQPHWYKNVFGNLTELRWEFILFPLLAFSAPLLATLRNRKVIGFWLVVALVGIFLSKGALEPLPQIYPWLFSHIPGFSLFRDPSKFFVFVCLGYAVLSGFTIDALIKRKELFVVGSYRFIALRSRMTQWLTPLLVASYLLLITFPVWTYKMTGILSVPRNAEAFSEVENILSNDANFSRVLWLPTRASLAYVSDTHLSLEASRLVGLRPFAIGVVGSYEVFNFLRDAPFMGEIMKVAGINYISYPYPDLKRQELKPEEVDYYNTFMKQVASLPWIESQLTNVPVPLWKTKESKDHFFLAPNQYFVVGSDRIYNDFVQIPGFDLSKNALTFLEENAALNSLFQNRTDIPVILYNKDKLDFAVSFLNSKNIIFPAKDISFEPNNEGLWKREASDVISWRAFLQEKYSIDNLDFDYGGGWTVLEGEKELKVETPIGTKPHVMFVRMMDSTKGGTVAFYQNDGKSTKQVQAISTKVVDPKTITLTIHGSEEIPDQNLEYEDAQFKWYEVGIVEPMYSMIVAKTEGDINVINAFVFVTEDEWATINKKISEYQVLDWNLLAESEKTSLVTTNAPASVTYTRISPVHYKVKVEGITRPQTLVFSETYDPLWELNGQKPVKIYSLLNGFRISENGEYDLYFSAQKYVNYGLVISGITIVVILILILRTKGVKYQS